MDDENSSISAQPTRTEVEMGKRDDENYQLS